MDIVLRLSQFTTELYVPALYILLTSTQPMTTQPTASNLLGPGHPKIYLAMKRHPTVSAKSKVLFLALINT